MRSRRSQGGPHYSEAIQIGIWRLSGGLLLWLGVRTSFGQIRRHRIAMRIGPSIAVIGLALGLGAAMGSLFFQRESDPLPVASPRQPDPEVVSALSEITEILVSIERKLSTAAMRSTEVEHDEDPDRMPSPPQLKGRTPKEAHTVGEAVPARPDPERLRELDEWSSRRDVRSQWLLSTDRDLVARFGVPDEITVTNLGEQWLYGYAEGRMVVRWYRFRLHDGRVIDMETFRQEPPVPMSRER